MRPNNDLIIGTQAPGGPVVPVSANATITSKTQWTAGIVRASFWAVITGTTASGSLQLQFSNDQAVGLPAGQFTPTNWVNLGAAVAVAAAGTYVVPAIASNAGYLETEYEYMQLVFTQTGGANNGTIYARMKSAGF